MKQVNVVYRLNIHTGQPYAVLARSDVLTDFPYMEVLTMEKWPCEVTAAPEEALVSQMGHVTWYHHDTRGPRHNEVKAFHWHVWRRLLSLGYEPKNIKCRQRLPRYDRVFKDYAAA